ncbi:PKD domain-containing protein [Lentzea sp. NEAU-D7]|uniref:PKD domain-containing protein n=1 Tax=Lentzea sp. NEAU-D7 TaxID=2994667 RepID=UPI00224A68B2|nr:PKD domain-containing protein [Lentzea sp. NEAU-D7]MCX2947066.1 PKD domain-containing protein [Lentzea sp. NEAU-D7]
MRALIIGAAVVLTAALAPGAAHAAPPSNDDFAGATVVTSLPFSSTVDTREGTAAADDPSTCWWSTSSVWFRYTAPSDGFVRMTTDRPDDQKPAVSAYTGERGALTWTPGACQFPHGGGSNTFAVTAGTTYHFLAQDTRFAGPVTFGLELVPRAAHDDLASAADIRLDTGVTGDTGPATIEAGETRPSCDLHSSRSLWFRYTADRALFVSAQVSDSRSHAGVAVFRGSALAEVDCRPSAHNPAIFAATPGETYYVRVADDVYGAGPLTLRLAEAPQIKPTAWWVSPRQPGVFDDVRFSIDPGDPAGRWLAGGEVRFGDGASAAIPAVPGTAEVSHRYAADGEYEVTITGHTADGRSGSSTQTLKVETHDVTVSNVVAPATATAGETGRVEVSVTSTRYAEGIVVDLLRRRPDGYHDVVGTVRGQVAKDGTVVLPFSYTYSAQDAALGKVTLKARVRLDGRDDNNPGDNERQAETTVVAAR